MDKKAESLKSKHEDSLRLALLVLSITLTVILALSTRYERSVAAPFPDVTTVLVTTPTNSPPITALPTRTPRPTKTIRPTNTRVVPTRTPRPTRTSTATPTPLPTPDGVARIVKVPILMYHYLSAPPDPENRVRVALSTPPDEFEAQLAYLKATGYETIKLADLVRHLQTGAPLPPKPIILTFDDGYLDHYINAYKLLRKYKFIGTFFVLTLFADERREGYLSWRQIRAMDRGGMEIGSHGLNHVELREQTANYIVWQVLGSKEALDARLREETRFFCYPAGRYDQRVIDLLHSAHYWGAVTTQQGVTQSSERPFELRRIRMSGWDGVEGLAAKLQIDWEEVENGQD